MSVKELVGFLSSERADVRRVAVQHVLGMTTTPDGIAELVAAHVISPLVALTEDPQGVIAHDATSALINMASMEENCHAMVEKGLIPRLMKQVMSRDNKIAGLHAMLLSNLSRTDLACRQLMNPPGVKPSNEDIAQAAKRRSVYVQILARLFTRERTGSEDPYRWLGTVLMNVSRVELGRTILLDEERKIIPLIINNILDRDPIRRGGAIGVIRNCCFDRSAHQYLLSDEVDVLPYIMTLIVGPEQMDAEEINGCPPELHRLLGPSKERDPDPEVRLMAVESLSLLSSTRDSRIMLRSRRVYPFLRELDRWEQDEPCKDAISKVIEVLIRDEGPAPAQVTETETTAAPQS